MASIIKVEKTVIHAGVDRKVARILRVAPFGVPSGIPPSIFSVKGSLIVGLGDGTYVELIPGTNGNVLVADATQAAGVRWQAPAAAAMRIASAPSIAAPAPDSDNVDLYILTAQAQAAAFGIPTGNPSQGQKLIIRIKDNGVARALSWNAIYRAVGVALPSTTAINKTLYVGMIYNATDNKWDVVAVGAEG